MTPPTSLETRTLGKDGPAVPVIGFGAWPIGGGMGTVDVQQAIRTIHHALDHGVTLIDTAEAYRTSEETIGKALAEWSGPREKIFLATKVRGTDLSRAHIVEAIEQSLRSLGTEYVDLLQAHSWDSRHAIDETMVAFDDLTRQGKVRYIGVSNFTGWQLMRSLEVSDAHGFERFVCLQPQYSLAERNIEREVLPVCVEEGLGVIPWSPLGGGFLSGKYRREEEPPEGSRIAGAEESMEEYWDRRATERNWATLDAVGRISEETGKSYAQISLNWLLRQNGVTAPIIGARTLEQLEDNIGASGWELSGDQVEELSEASALEDVYPYRFIRNAQRV